MKDLAIFVNNSDGELDWIAPFVTSDEAACWRFWVFVNHPHIDPAERRRVFEKYFGDSESVEYLNDYVAVSEWAARFDYYCDRILRRVRRLNYSVFVALRTGADFLRKLLALLAAERYDAPKFDGIFRDYNLKDSVALAVLLQKNRNSAVVIYPHSTAIISRSKRLPKDPAKKVRADLFLENTHLSDRFEPVYGQVTKVVGSPQISYNYVRKSAFDPDSDTILVITRNCDPGFFGFTQEGANEVFECILSEAAHIGRRVVVKHHPRDNRVSEWRRVQARYACATETTHSLNEYTIPTAMVLSFYSGAGLLLVAQGIPLFDVSPYDSNNVKDLPYHFLDDEGRVSHEFIERGVMQYVEDPREVLRLGRGRSLQELGRQQRSALKEIFPSGTNQAIRESLGGILTDDGAV